MTALAILRSGLERILQAVCVILMFSLTGFVLVAVAYREWGSSLSWYDEVATIVLAWLTYYAGALAALKRGHLGSPAILSALPPRPRLVLFVLSEALVIGFFLFLAWLGLEVVILLQGDYLISLPWVPVQFTQSVIPVGGVIFALAQALSIPDQWREIQGLAPRDAAHAAREVI